MYVLGLELGVEVLDLVVFVLQLLGKVLDSLLQFGTLHRAVLHLLAQLCYDFAVLGHALLDELHILAYLLRPACALSVLGNADALLGLVDLAEAFHNLVEQAHHVVDFVVFLLYYSLQRVTLARLRQVGSLLPVITSDQSQETSRQKQYFLHNYLFFNITLLLRYMPLPFDGQASAVAVK